MAFWGCQLIRFLLFSSLFSPTGTCCLGLKYCLARNVSKHMLARSLTHWLPFSSRSVGLREKCLDVMQVIYWAFTMIWMSDTGSIHQTSCKLKKWLIFGEHFAVITLYYWQFQSQINISSVSRSSIHLVKDIAYFVIGGYVYNIESAIFFPLFCVCVPYCL